MATAEKSLLALERSADRPVEYRLMTPLAMRRPLINWRIIAAIAQFLKLVRLLLLTQ
ncbi:hypothetical protein [Candidatus Accumulibacter sp. ACC003]|uniref:hypothetical protein n=1 Tax=Candidatus Accumulibacter sp. ACC003 TaxID=2823334 RepID=UPI0025C0B4A9|nr:hypothetical protein [Candidatus Accumulibacter sp. ACC003]